MNNQETRSADNGGAAFQKAWLESWSKAMQAAFAPAAGSTPTDLFRQLQDSSVQALQQIWNPYLNPTRFMESVQQWMGASATADPPRSESTPTERPEGRPLSGDEFNAFASAVQRIEAALHHRVEQLSEQTQELSQRLARLEDQLRAERTVPRNGRPAHRPKAPRRRPSRTAEGA